MRALQGRQGHTAQALLMACKSFPRPLETAMKPASLAIRAAFWALSHCRPRTAARADALDDIMKAKVIKVAVPQDFAPFGSAGPDLKPVGYDIDMANLIGKELGVKVEIIPVTSANRIPYLQTKKAHIVISSLGTKSRARKGHRFFSGLRAVLLGRLRHQGPRGRQARGPRRQDHRRDPRRDRGAGSLEDGAAPPPP